MRGDFLVGGCLARPELHHIEAEGGEKRSVEPRSMEVLVYLAENAGEVCSRDEILSAVWSDAFVGEAALTHCIWDLRRAFGDEAREPRFIQTVPRRGYRLIAAVGIPDEEPSHDQPSPPQRLRMGGLIVAALLLITLGATSLLRQPRQSIRIAVIQPEVGSVTPELEVAAFAVRLATLQSLASLRGLSPLDPSELGGATDIVAAARASSADEVISSSVHEQGRLCRVSLRRLDSEGRVLWTDVAVAPIDPAQSILLARAVAAKLRLAYAEFTPRDESSMLEVADADFKTYLDIRRRHDEGEEASALMLSDVDAMLESSPRFLEGYLLAAELTWRIGRRSREPPWLERAANLATAAAQLAPKDPRPLTLSFRIALASERTADATAALEGLRNLEPGSPETLLAHSQLHAAEGNLREAIDLARQVTELRPSWKAFFHLATLSERSGDHAAGRKYLRAVLERSPGNRRGLSRLAELELVYGDLTEARKLYEKLLEDRSSRRYLINLGIVRFLMGDYQDAAQAYEKALKLEPNHIEAVFNLAETRSALGLHEEAQKGYRQVLSLLTDLEQQNPLGPIDRLLMALCLAHKGDGRGAVRITQSTLRDHPEHADVAYLSAMVYTLTGDKNSALVNIERALTLGIRPRWFHVPAFASIMDDAVVQALLTAEEERAAAEL